LDGHRYNIVCVVLLYVSHELFGLTIFRKKEKEREKENRAVDEEVIVCSNDRVDECSAEVAYSNIPPAKFVTPFLC
jgi:hypothetical protein